MLLLHAVEMLLDCLSGAVGAEFAVQMSCDRLIVTLDIVARDDVEEHLAIDIGYDVVVSGRYQQG